MDLEKDLDDLDDDDDADVSEEEQQLSVSSSRRSRPDDYNDEEWEIKSSIGLDCTLDYEEEEDEYDKVAVGKEKKGDRLYMKDINDYEIESGDSNTIPDSFTDISRDPRANHIAAKIRLKEDAEAAKRIDSLRVSENDAPAAVECQINSSEDVTLKSILKRKDTQADTRSQKRVRFDSECKTDSEKGSERVEDIMTETFSTENITLTSEELKLHPAYPSGVPDYLRNPSKYTHYTFDSSDMDEASNKQAYMDFLNLLKRRKGESQSDDAPVQLPKSVTFIPKRKTDEITVQENSTISKQTQDDAGKESVHSKGLPVGIAASVTGDEVCAMEEDEADIAPDRSALQKSGRKYRMKARSDPDESLS